MSNKKGLNDSASIATGFIFLAGILAVGFYFIMFVLPMVGGVNVQYNAMTQSGQIPVSAAHTQSINNSATLVQASPIVAFFVLVIWAIIEFRKSRDNEV